MVSATESDVAIINEETDYSDSEINMEELKDEEANDVEMEDEDSAIVIPKSEEEEFEQLIKDLIVEYEKRGQLLLAMIFRQSKLKLSKGIMKMMVPSGYKNDNIISELLPIKQFLHAQMPNVDFEFEIEETQYEFKQDVPYTDKDKAEDLVKRNPVINEWFEKLDLKM